MYSMLVISFKTAHLQSIMHKLDKCFMQYLVHLLFFRLLLVSSTPFLSTPVLCTLSVCPLLLTVPPAASWRMLASM